MSRADHIVLRRQEGKRNGKAKKRRIKLPNGKTVSVLPTTHIQGNQWWRTRFADLVDRKNDDGTVTPRAKPKSIPAPQTPAPERLPRPEGLARQTHRRLYRVAAKMSGVDWRTGQNTPTDKRDARRNRGQRNRFLGRQARRCG